MAKGQFYKTKGIMSVLQAHNALQATGVHFLPMLSASGKRLSDGFPGTFVHAVAGLVAAAAGGEDHTRQGVCINIQERLSADRTADRDHCPGCAVAGSGSCGLGHGSPSLIMSV